MKISTKFSDRMRALALAMFLSGAAASMQAAVHYVRMAADATSWSGIAGADIISSDTPELIPADTYYFAKGTYTLIALGVDPVTTLPTPITPSLTTGAIYGGFSGTETEIDLTKRALSDKDGNGIVEPWEMTNETIIKGSVPFADGSGSSLRLLTVTGGEVNGVTFSDHYYYGQNPSTQTSPFNGTIILGVVSSNPAIADNVPEKAARMLFCTVKRLKVGGNGTIMMTNSKSVIDKCLIEECQAQGWIANGGGGAVWMNSYGGTISNSVLRNNRALASVGTSAGRGGAIYSTTPGAINNSATVVNCAIYNNTSNNSGGAMRMEGKSAGSGLLSSQVINCSVVNNYTTPGSLGVASMELIFDGALLVNSICVGDVRDELRPQAANQYYSNIVFGTKNGTVAMTPATDTVGHKVTADLKFKKATKFSGCMVDGESDPFDQAVYDSIRTTNLSIVDATSPAVTTPGLATMPAAFTSNPAIIPTATIPTTDITGAARTGSVTLGAYQFTGSSAVSISKADKVTAYAVAGGILVSAKAGKIANVYSLTGKLVKKEVLKADVQVIDVQKGFYIVSVGNAKAKVFVK